MKTRVAALSVIVEDPSSVTELNELLHEVRGYVLGRMGIPYRKRQISIISIAVEAPQDVINTLAGRIGKLSGVSVKTAYSSYEYENDAQE